MVPAGSGFLDTAGGGFTSLRVSRSGRPPHFKGRGKAE